MDGFSRPTGSSSRVWRSVQLATTRSEGSIFTGGCCTALPTLASATTGLSNRMRMAGSCRAVPLPSAPRGEKEVTLTFGPFCTGWFTPPQPDRAPTSRNSPARAVMKKTTTPGVQSRC